MPGDYGSGKKKNPRKIVSAQPPDRAGRIWSEKVGSVEKQGER